VRHLVIGTAGHIDHGKSALVRALTGTDPDRLKEEKARGITIDLGFAHWQAANVTVAFVDVPGHERFVKNMLAGVGGIDAVLLIVAADESVMPQTREHFAICRLLRIPRGLIALTKSDLVDADTLELVRLEARELVAGSFLENAPILAVSSTTGAGLPALRDALVDLARTAPARPAGGGARLPIDRVFTIRGFGTVVTGTLVSGEIHENDELVLLPGERVVKVRGLQVHGHAAPRAEAGQRTAVNLGGVDVQDLSRGQTLTEPDVLEPTRRLDVLLELLPDAKPLRHGARVRFHHGTMELLGRVSLADAPGRGGAAPLNDAAAPAMTPGTRGYGRLRLEAPAVVTRGDRFIVRAYSPPATIGGGVVLDPRPPRGGIRTAAARERLRRIDPSQRDPAVAARAAVVAMLSEAGAAGLRVATLTSRAGVPPEEVEPLVGELVREGTAVRVGDVLLAPDVLGTLRSELLRHVEEHHRANPLVAGLPREEARERLFARASPAVFDHVIDALVREGRVVATERLALVTHRVSLSGDEARARTTIERVMRDAALKPPDEAALAASVQAPSDVVDRVLKLLVREKVLVRVEGLLFHADALRQLKTEIASLKQTAGAAARVDVASFKEKYGVTRKFAIPLLEYLDRERVTRRVGETRVIL
jgi:selenocysteine-specific elongation factor